MSQGISFVTRQGLDRVKGAILALSLPLLLIALAIGVGFRDGGGEVDFGSSFVAVVMFLVAAPTAWIFAIDFIEAERFTVMLAGALTSLPLWGFAGAVIAANSTSWPQWSLRYVALCAVWITFYVLAIGVMAALLG